MVSQKNSLSKKWQVLDLGSVREEEKHSLTGWAWNLAKKEKWKGEGRDFNEILKDLFASHQNVLL